jgi:hypothetical protein
MTELLVYAYRIPDTYFKPYKVKSPFYARVSYRVENGNAKIEEVGLSGNALDYISGMSQMKKDIQCKLDQMTANSHVNPIVLGSIAHFIRP